MVVKKISVCLLLGHLHAAFCSACVPVWCLRCNVTDPCPLCLNSSADCITKPLDFPPNCKKDFQVSVNNTASMVQEGDDVTLTCVYNLTNISGLWWENNGKRIPGQNQSELVLQKVSPNDQGQYICFVASLCGTYNSLPHDVTVNSNNVLLLLICGVSALVLVMFMGLAMKFKLKRDSAKHKERIRQRAGAGQSDGPAGFTSR